MRKYLYSVFLFLLINCSVFGQVYQIGHTTITFIDASRNNRNIPTEIYYPADTTGTNVAFTTLNSIQFPSLVFGHGFLMTWDAYQNYWSALVPNGYIMAFPKTEGSFSPSHIEFARDLAFVINAIQALNNQPSSLFYNRVSSNNAVMGHSMGGGAAVLAVSSNSNIKSLVSFAPAETNPSAISSASNISVPTLLFAGSNDCVTPPNTNQLPIYNSLNSSCKTYLSILGGNHCQMAQSNTFCSIGEATCSPNATISRQVQHAKINSYLLLWLNYQLKGICSSGNLFDTQIVNDTQITYIKNCVQCASLATNNENGFQKNEIVVYPVPATDFVEFRGLPNTSYELKIVDFNNKLILEIKFTGFKKIDLSNLASGVYFYESSDFFGKTEKGKIIKKQ